MKKPLFLLSALLVAAFFLAACSTDNTTVVQYSDKCYISSFTLGQMRRTIHTKDTEGKDSTYQVSFSGSLYKLLIDQRAQTITNRDSLPTGTHLNAVLATITGTGAISYAVLPDTAEWKSYSESDSIDFTSPLLFRVFAEDGVNHRDYTVRIHVRQAVPGDFSWTRLADVREPGSDADDCRLLMANENLVLLSYNATTGQLHTFKASDPVNPAWEENVATGLPADPDVRSAQYYDNRFWMSCNRQLYSSADAVTWEQVPVSAESHLLQLIAASPDVLYASTQDADAAPGIARSTDGVTWTAMEVEAGGFTGRPCASLAYQQENGNERVMLLDNVLGGCSPLSVWNLLEDSDEPWILFAQSGDNDHLLLARERLCLILYDDFLIALGGKYVGGDTASSLAAAYFSYDNGIDWWTDEYLTLPESVLGSTAPVAAVGEGEYLWIVVGSQVWRARQNSYGE